MSRRAAGGRFRRWYHASCRTGQLNLAGIDSADLCICSLIPSRSPFSSCPTEITGVSDVDGIRSSISRIRQIDYLLFYLLCGLQLVSDDKDGGKSRNLGRDNGGSVQIVAAISRTIRTLGSFGVSTRSTNTKFSKPCDSSEGGMVTEIEKGQILRPIDVPLRRNLVHERLQGALLEKKAISPH